MKTTKKNEDQSSAANGEWRVAIRVGRGVKKNITFAVLEWTNRPAGIDS